MSTNFYMKQLLGIVFLICACTSGLYAQVKVGSNPTSISATSNLEVEASNGNKTVIQKSNGNMGVGTDTPGNKLEVNSGVANTSGLRFTNLKNSTPGATGSAKAVGVDASGDVVTLEPSATQVYVPVLKAPINGFTTTATTDSRTLTMGTTEFNTISGATVSGSTISLPAGLYRANITFTAGFSANAVANITTATLLVNNTALQKIASYATSGSNVGAYSGVITFQLTSPGTVSISTVQQQASGTFTLFGGSQNSTIAIEKLQ